MKREDRIPRPDWPKKMEDLGFSFSSGRPSALTRCAG